MLSAYSPVSRGADAWPADFTRSPRDNRSASTSADDNSSAIPLWLSLTFTRPMSALHHVRADHEARFPASERVTPRCRPTHDVALETSDNDTVAGLDVCRF